MDIAELARLIENLIRIGTVTDVRHTQPSAVRVQSGGTVTHWLPMLQQRADGTRTWNPPTKGEQVVLLCPSGDLSNGIALFAIPFTANDVSSHSTNETVTLCADDALTKYDNAAGLLTGAGRENHLPGIRHQGHQRAASCRLLSPPSCAESRASA
ncbi:phage baseplate assembly protein V [Ralstonia chuxiongensis]|uniref:phage baseplate assembly protein V n=1 Tax=Ralstonia chuxiongensis TaxID=2957504 RepID=UPI0028F54E4F|nr:phage baseplate assembly protein V [Ralstonia chuxiongensis]CAJ0784596.1 hypothetical protein R8510_05278 [Ralstonia chuxiongensis]